MLPLGGLLMALFVGYVMNRAIVKKELNAHQSIIDIWFMIIKIFSPILLIIIFIQGIL
jgi:NSS family neurotransmitter:Na+ symporter